MPQIIRYKLAALKKKSAAITGSTIDLPFRLLCTSHQTAAKNGGVAKICIPKNITGSTSYFSPSAR